MGRSKALQSEAVRILRAIAAADRPMSPSRLLPEADDRDTLIRALFQLEARLLITWSRATGWVTIRQAGRDLLETAWYRAAAQ